MTDRPSIVAALNAVKAEVGAVGKTDRNYQQNFDFRGIEAVLNAVSPALRQNGVLVTPYELRKYEYATVEVGKNRTPMGHVLVEVTYRFHGPAGDHLDATVPGEAMDSGDKATTKAMSVAYRTALIQTLSLPTHEADPDEESYERSQPPAQDDLQAEPADSTDLLKRQVWKAAQAVGLTTREALEQDFAMSMNGCVITDANPGELRCYLDSIKARQQEASGE